MTELAPPQGVDVEHLFADHMGLARSLARRFSNRGESQDDLEQVALLALIKAARRFDEGRQVSFATFATVSVVGELKRHFRDRGWWVRVPRRIQDAHLRLREANERLGQELGRGPTAQELAVHLELSEEAVLEAMEAGNHYRPASLDKPVIDGGTLMDGLASGDAGYDAVDSHQELAELLPRLPPQEKLVLRRYYFDDRTQAEIGREIGVSQMQVSRLISRSLHRLRAQGGSSPSLR